MTKIPNLKLRIVIEYSRLSCFDHWNFEFGICPSTWLRVVSLSNHLKFGVCVLSFSHNGRNIIFDTPIT